jgi:hypothetical protein
MIILYSNPIDEVRSVLFLLSPYVYGLIHSESSHAIIKISYSQSGISI